MSSPRPDDAWWSEADREWVFGPHDAEGRLHGLVRYWDADGRFISDCEHVAGRPHGLARRFNADGSLAQEASYVEGRISGVRRCHRPADPNHALAGLFARASDTVAVYECEYDAGDLIATRFRDGEGREVAAQGRPVAARPPGVPATAGPMPSGEWLAMRRRGEDGDHTLETRIWYPDGQLREVSLADGSCREFHPNGALRSEGARIEDGTSRRMHGPWRYGDAAGVVRRESLYERGVERTRTWWRPAAEAGPGGEVVRAGPVVAAADRGDALECGRWEVRDERGCVLRVVELGAAIDDDGLLADRSLADEVDDAALQAGVAADPGGAAGRIAGLRLAARRGSVEDPATFVGPGPAWGRIDRGGEPVADDADHVRLAELVHGLAWGVPASEALGELSARLLRADRPRAALELVDAARLLAGQGQLLADTRVACLRVLGRDDEAEKELHRARPRRLGAREEAMLLALRDRPDDLAGWLAYADLIADRHPTRAAKLRAAAGEGVDAVLAVLLAQLPKKSEARIRGGTLYVEAGAFLEHHDALLRAAPLVHELVLESATDAIARLATLPALRRYTSLTLSETLLFEGAAAQLARSPHLGQLRHLGIANTCLYDEDLQAILRSRAYPRLTSLDISNQRSDQDYGYAGFRELADAAFAPTLEALAMDRRWMEEDVVAVLAALPRLHDLGLEGGRLGDEGAIALAELPRPWTRLDLRWNHIGELGALALALAPSLAGVEWLGIGNNPLGEDGLRELVGAPQLARVRTLELAGGTEDRVRPTAALGQALVTAPMAASLESLELSLGALGPAGARGLAAAPLVRLRRLGLYGNGIGDAGAVALAGSSALASLRSLDLGNNDLHDDAALALAASPHLGALERLELGGATLTSRAREALKARFGERVRLKYPWG